MEARPNGHPHATQGCARTGTLLHLQEPGLRGVTLLLPPQQTLKKYRGCREPYCKEEEMGLLEKGGEGEGIGEDHLCCKRR